MIESFSGALATWRAAAFSELVFPTVSLSRMKQTEKDRLSSWNLPRFTAGAGLNQPCITSTHFKPEPDRLSVCDAVRAGIK